MKTQTNNRIAAHLIRAMLACLLLLSGIANGFAADRVTHIHTDILGSPVAASDEDGELLWRQRYKPYGEPTGGAGYKEEISYTSKQTDRDTGLIYFGARNYDPVIGRFLSIDPVGFDENNPPSFNRYAYVNNNPYRYVDPDGRFLETIFIDIPSLIISAAALTQAPSLGNAAAFIYDLSATLIPGLPGGAGVAKQTAKAVEGAGDLTKKELDQIQRVVNEAGRPVEIVGSAARRARRNVGTDLPIGKGPKTRSDIDILIPASSKGNFNGISNKFPAGSDVNIGTANPNIGPRIRVEPNF